MTARARAATTGGGGGELLPGFRHGQGRLSQFIFSTTPETVALRAVVPIYMLWICRPSVCRLLEAIARFALPHATACAQGESRPAHRNLARPAYLGLVATRPAKAMKPKNRPSSTRRRASSFSSAASFESIRSELTSKSAPRSTSVSM